MKINKITTSKTWRSSLVFVAAALLIVLISAVQYYYTRDMLEDQLDDRALGELRSKSSRLSNTLKQAEQTLNEHLWDIRRNINNPDSMYNVTKRLLNVNEMLVGSCICFAPDFYPEKGRLFEPYAYKQNGKVNVVQLCADGLHDYTQNPAFLRVVETKEPFWSTPYEYTDSDGKTMSLTTYSFPLLSKNGKVLAVIGLDLSLSWLGDRLNRSHIYPSSYDIFLTPEGKYITGPSSYEIAPADERVRVMNMVNDSTLKKYSFSNGKFKMFEFVDDYEKLCYVYHTKMENEPYWQIAVICEDNEVYGKLYSMSRFMLIMTTIAWLIMGIIIWRAIRGHIRLQQAEAERQQIENELSIARKIQEEMLPKTFPPYPERKDLDIFGSLTPAKEVGGDLFDFFLSDEKLFFCIGDVSGKGIPAAMVMTMTHSLFRMATSHDDNPASIMQNINETFCKGNNSGMFVTMFIGILDLTTGKMGYCNAGHEIAFLVSEENIRPLDLIANMPIGVFSDFKYESQEEVMESGTTLFTYTDGLTEAMNEERKRYGIARVEEAITSSISIIPKDLIEHVNKDVHKFVKEAPQSDDLTMLAIKYNRK